MALRILMFSDFICPFCYIGFAIMRKLEAELDLDLQWKGYQIHPEWPAEGILARDFYREDRPESRRALWDRIAAMAAKIQLPIKPPSMLANSRHALEAAEFANEAGLADAFEERIYRAYFQEGANIGDRRIVSGLAAEIGIDQVALSEAMATGRYELKLKNNALMANQRGVSGVPTFFIGRFPLVGTQTEETIRQMIIRAAALA